jgi:hypothetical protein
MAINIQGKTSYSPAIITDGLVLCLDAASRKSYPGSGTVWRDLAGSNNGTLVNGPTFSNANGGSIVFDGVNNYVGVNNSVGNFETSNFTISFYFRTTEELTPRTFIAKSIGGSPTIGYGWLVNNSTSGGNELGFAVANVNGAWGTNGSYSIRTLGANIRNGIWQMATIVGNRTQTNVSIYINAIVQSLQSYVGAASFSSVGNITNNHILNIGSESDINTSPFPIRANISNILLYNRALTPQEVLQNYNATKGRYNL